MPILTLCLFVLALLVVSVTAHLGVQTVRRHSKAPQNSLSEMIVLLAPLAAGGVALWYILTWNGEALSVETGPLPVSIRVGSLCLYLAGWVIYAEVGSLVSRGYSLRILVDLLDRGGEASVEALKAGYGGGRGVQGLLAKRLRTLTELRLLHLPEGRIGSLTFLGRIVASTGFGLRRLLKLESVG